MLSVDKFLVVNGSSPSSPSDDLLPAVLRGAPTLTLSSLMDPTAAKQRPPRSPVGPKSKEISTQVSESSVKRQVDLVIHVYD